MRAEVRGSVNQKNTTALVAVTHALKRAVCSVTQKGALHVAIELETLARVGDLRHADRALQKLETEMERLVSALMTCQKTDSNKAFGASASSQA